MASVTQTCNVLSPSQNGFELQKLLEGMRADLEALRASHAAMALKLNADGGVADTNYASVASLKTTV